MEHSSEARDLHKPPGDCDADSGIDPGSRRLVCLLEVTAASDLRFFSTGLSATCAYAAPLALLAAGVGHRLKGTGQVIKVAVWGLVVPLGGTLIVTMVIGIMTHASSFYTPSLPPTVMMALWSKTPFSYARPAHLLGAWLQRSAQSELV